jgi:hypothetical protein
LADVWASPLLRTASTSSVVLQRETNGKGSGSGSKSNQDKGHKEALVRLMPSRTYLAILTGRLLVAAMVVLCVQTCIRSQTAEVKVRAAVVDARTAIALLLFCIF